MYIQGGIPVAVAVVAVLLPVADHEDLSLMVSLLALLHHDYVIQLPVESALVVLSHHLAVLPLHHLTLRFLLAWLDLGIRFAPLDVVLEH